MNQIAGLGNQVCNFWNSTVTDGIDYSGKNPEIALVSYLGTTVATATSTYLTTKSVKWAAVAAMVTAALPHGLEGLMSLVCSQESKYDKLNDILFNQFPKIAQEKASDCANVVSETVATASKWAEKKINEFRNN